jgi:hypothetical protein
MAETIVDGTLFNPMNTMYTTPKANEKGGKSLNILNKFTKTGLRLSTPLMLTWGASDFIDQDGNGNGKYEMALQFPQEEYSNDDCKAFLKNMQALEDKIKADALIHSKDWFGKLHKSADIIEELFSPMLKYPKIKGTSEPDYSKKPTLRLKLPQWQGAWKCEIYDEDSNPLFPNKENHTVTPLDYLKKGAMVACVIQCGGIWFTNGKFTVTWKLLQAAVQKPKASISGQCLIKLKPAEKEQLKASAPVQDDEVDDSIQAQVEDSDDEDEVVPPTPPAQVITQVTTPVSVQQVEPEVAVAAVAVEDKPKKKIVRKKTDA